MKKKLFFFLGVLCSYGFYSCQKSMTESNQQGISETAAKKSAEAPTSLTDGSATEVSYDHDATNTFTEGPAVDKFGNVFLAIRIMIRFTGGMQVLAR